MSNFLNLYEPLDIIGTGSFGIIRKVRRKSDGMVSVVFAVVLLFCLITTFVPDIRAQGAQIRANVGEG